MNRWTRAFQVTLAVLYFAYGSNMSWTQMQHRCPGARFKCVAKLADHKLAFTRTSERWQGGGVADVAPDSGKAVWGVVYEVTPADLDSLDRWEGYVEGRAANEYTRGKVTILDRGRASKPLEAWIYRAVPQGPHFAPGAAYRDTLVAGAKHWKLPELYVEDLEAIPVAK
jgi:gamma-glutamylcyclotransferase (GGCT)/AIG2-like uncharacterized protein YtfP